MSFFNSWKPQGLSYSIINQDHIMLGPISPKTIGDSSSSVETPSKTIEIDNDHNQELNYYKRRSSLFTKIMALLFIINIIFAIMLGITIKSKTNPTFLQDYLGSFNQYHSSTFMKFRNTLLTQSKVELLNKDHQVLPIHSHNDYWRKTPLFDALRLGINSVEADVWYLPSSKDSPLNPPELYVGHHRYKLSSYKTLESLYLSNLEALLDDVNSKIPNDNEDFGSNTLDNHNFTKPQEWENKLHGVFYDDPDKSLYLIIDIKTHPNDTFKVLETFLIPFIEKDYLSFYDSTTSKFYKGPITIIISGNIPYELIKQQKYRFTFIDAPLDHDDFALKYDNTTSIYSSSSLKRLTGSNSALGFNGLSDEQKSILSSKFKMAHDLGIKVRVWDTPKWPLTIRNAVWKDLLELGVDLLNVDDLQGAVAF